MSRRRNIGKYISLEASEDESETEIESEDVDDIAEEAPAIPRPNYVSIAQQIERKYSYHSDEEEDETLEEGLMQSQLLPRNNSPRLFLVRVSRGAEKEIALRILANKPNICSVVVKDGLRGYLYIEAFQRQQVLDSFGKVRGINKNKISIVPQDEMIDALTYRTDFKCVEFGRIKKGKYKGDLVSIVDNEGDMVTIRLVPRINGIKKLFNPDEFKDEVQRRDKNSFWYKKDLYVGGFLEKEVLKNTVDFEAEPNFEELEQFHVRKVFEVEDKVRVTKGELIGLEGTVKSVMGNTVSVQTKDKKSYEVQSDALDKFYNIGEEVCFKGENGIITNYADGFYYIVIRDFTEEVKVTIDKISRPIPVTKEVVRKDRPRQVFRRDGLINKQVQIKRGKFKGHTGTVKDVYMNKCRIQINTNLSCITIPREDVQEIDRVLQPEYVTAYTRPYAKTPVYENIKTDTLENPETTNLYAGVLIKARGDVLKVDDFVGNTFFTEKGTFERQGVEFVAPGKNDGVVIMDGDYKGSRAVVLDLKDDNQCVVKIKNGVVKNLPLGCVCKLLE